MMKHLIRPILQYNRKQISFVFQKTILLGKHCFPKNLNPRMIKLQFTYTVAFLFSFILSCNGTQNTTAQTASTAKTRNQDTRNFRDDMRDFVVKISEYSKAINSDFAIIPQNGIELVTDTGYASGQPMTTYLSAIDANGQENLHYGYHGDNKRTPKRSGDYMNGLLKVSQQAGNSIFVIDYCDSDKKIADAHAQSYTKNFIPFVATERNLTVIPKTTPGLNKMNTDDVEGLNAAKNFLFFLNYENFDTKSNLINTIAKTDYDVVFIDLFFNDGTPFTSNEINSLKTKENGAKRLVCCYMSIGEAEDYRFYWKKQWNKNKPSWLDAENKNWPGNYKVKYWDTNWQNIILGRENAYLDKILKASFDGVYLDIIDAFEYFEAN